MNKTTLTIVHRNINVSPSPLRSHLQGKMPPTFFTEMTLVRRQTQLMRAREVVEIFHLRPGTYVLVPCTEIPGNECGFVLRTFYQKKDASSQVQGTYLITRLIMVMGFRVCQTPGRSW
uniref:Peptidase C2 calpain large subunit domain-containing protein n=1 Tax=Callorhinchus milii TaxID=7868 RepID=A0A4W3JXU9_CALMI